MTVKKLLFPFLFILLGFISCSDDDSWDTSSEEDNVILPQPGSQKSLYILSEGEWQKSNSSLTYYDYDNASFTNDYFGKINPEQGGLGDVGNDLKIYKDKMYAVINNSNYVEVMDAKTAKHIGKINIPNCRYITFNGNYAYVSSFASNTPNGKGYVAKINIDSRTIVDEVTVGFSPEELTIANNKLYIANSGGYTPAAYDNTVSIIDLNTFTKINEITVGDNLWRIRTDKNNNIWVTSRGNYEDIKPFVSVIDPDTDQIINKLEVTISDLDFYNENLYFYGTDYSTGKPTNNYGIINVDTKKLTSSGLINSSTKSTIMVPYGIIVDPADGSFFLADALDFQSNGKVYHFNKDGSLKWWRTVGITPGHFAFLIK